MRPMRAALVALSLCSSEAFGLARLGVGRISRPSARRVTMSEGAGSPLSAQEAESLDAPWSADEVDALKAAMNKPTGTLFGGAGAGSSERKLKAAALGGPLASETWDEVRADSALLAAKTDEELAAGFLSLERGMAAEAAAAKSSSASSAPASSGGILSGALPLIAVLVTAFATANFLSAGGGCTSDFANSAACAEKAERASGTVQATPLERYRSAVISSSDEALGSYTSEPRILLPDVSGAARNLGDVDWWKGTKK